MKAGITKHITFHCGRHTFAVLQLSLGTEIYTLSKLLGHRELKTTQVYAQIMDERKREAVTGFRNYDYFGRRGISLRSCTATDRP